MRHLVAHLRQYLVHDLGRLALDPRAYTELLKVGVFKAGGAVTAGLLIPVTALATYSIPARAIERITAPIVSAAPDIFDVRSLGRLSRARLRDALNAPDTVRRALGGPADVLDPGSSDLTLSPADGFAAGDTGLFGAGSVSDRLAPPEAAPGDAVDPGDDEPATEGSGGGGYAQGPNDPHPDSDDVTGDSGEDGEDEGDEQDGDSGPAEGQVGGDQQDDQGDEDNQDEGGQVGGGEDSGDDQDHTGGTGGTADGGANHEDTGSTDPGQESPGGDQGQGDQQGDDDDPGDDGDEDDGDDGDDSDDSDDDHADDDDHGDSDDDESDDDDDSDDDDQGDDDDGKDKKDKGDHNGDGHPDNGNGH